MIPSDFLDCLRVLSVIVLLGEDQRFKFKYFDG